MKRTHKRIFTVLLAVCTLLSLSVPITWAEETGSTSTVLNYYTKSYGDTIKVRTAGDGGTYVEPNFPALNITQGHSAWTFAGRRLSGATGSADGTRVNLTSTSMTVYFSESNASSSTNGDWVALKLIGVPQGTYKLELTNEYNANNGAVDVYVMPAAAYSTVASYYAALNSSNVNSSMNTLLSNIDAGNVQNAQKMGQVFNSKLNPAAAQDLGTYTCAADGDYVLVFRCAAGQTSNCRMVLRQIALTPQGGSEPLDTIVDVESLMLSPIGEFEVGNNDFVATSVVNGHDYLYVALNRAFLVYDLDTMEKVDEEYAGMSESDGIFIDSDGIVWMYGQSSKLFRYDPVTGQGRSVSQAQINNGSSSGVNIYYPIEVNGKLYTGSYPDGHLVEYNPNTDTYTDLGSLVEKGKKLTTLAYKNGYIYASVHAAAATQLPHVLVKYDLAAKRVVATLDLSAAGVMEASYLTQTVIVGDVLFGASTKQLDMIAVNINTMQLVDVGCDVGAVHGFSQVIVEEGNEKVYFFKRDSSSAYTFCEYNSSTGTVTPVTGFARTTNQFNTRGSSFVTLNLDGQTRQYLLVGMEKDGTVVLYDLANKQVEKVEGLTEGDSSPLTILEFQAGPSGSNEIYLGAFMSNIAGVYDITTNTMKKMYPCYSEQIETTGWYNGKWYVSGYGACSISEMNYETGTYEVLFALNEADKLNFVQERIKNITAGGGKVFGTTVPHKNIQGGFIVWYDYEEETTFVAVEEDKVLYQRDSDKTGWYDAKTHERIVFNTADNGANDFEGFIAGQNVNSLYYIDGYLYGTTYVGGGDTAKMFVYDVENLEMVATYDIEDGIQGLATPVISIGAFAPDPEVAGKFWGVVAQTLFTATFNMETKTFQVQEVLSFGKTNYVAYRDHNKSGQIYFDDGYIIVNFRDLDPAKPGTGESVGNMRIINMLDPTYNFCLSTDTARQYVLGEDDNIYVEYYAGIGVLRTADIIAAIKANGPKAKVGESTFVTVEDAIKEAKTNGGTVTLLTAVDAGAISIDNGVTLDLNGKVLTASSIACNGTGVVTDSKDGAGRIKSANINLKTDNKHLVIGNGTDGYGVYAGSVVCAPANGNKAEGVKFTFGLKDAVNAYGAIATYGLRVEANLKVDGQDVVNTPVFAETLVKEWAEQGAGFGLFVRVTGLENVENALELTPKIGNLTGAAITYTAQ